MASAVGATQHFQTRFAHCARASAEPRRIANRFLGALGERKSGMVFLVRRGRERNLTGHSVIRRFFT
jgi:hypothetical protein